MVHDEKKNVNDEHAHKHMIPRTDDEKQKVLNRLKRIEGQVRGIQKMVEDDRYCIDILTQISAINSALKNTGMQLLERHMHHCVTDAIQTGEGEQSIEELMKVMQQLSK